jgi:hypothetical protein
MHHVQEMLGHTNLEQTGTYLNVTATGLRESMRRFEVPGTYVTSKSHEAPIEHPPLCHGAAESGPQPLVN